MNDTQLQMTDHELLALLSMTPTESAATTLKLLRLDQHGDNQLFHSAGLTTLMVRGLAAPQGEKIVPVDRCAVVGSVLSQAQEWLEITFTTPSNKHALIAVGSNVGALLLSISPYGVHDVQPIESGPALLELGLHLAREYLTGAAEGLPATAAMRRLRVAGQRNEAHLTATETGKWALRVAAAPGETSHAPAEAMELFRSALAA